MSVFKSEAFSGLILLASALVAIIAVNAGFEQIYHAFLALQMGPLTLTSWINDGLMAFFFFVIGMEIKLEMTQGSLASFDRAILPVAGALGGMIAPALIFLAFAHGHTFESGWGIPMATDIAFAVGVLALFGPRVPAQLKIFLLALAIADDLGAVLVIAFAYTAEIHWAYLAAGFAWLGVIALTPRLKILSCALILLNIVLGVIVWWFIHHSGLHATIAGCLLGFLVKDPRAWANRLHGLSAFFVMPVFAFANAGLSFSAPLDWASPLVSGVSYGLLIGKPAGIFLACWLSVKMKIARYDGDWLALFGVASLGGIGFTMSLFIASLGLSPQGLELAKLGIVKGSLLSACAGGVILALSGLRRTPRG